MSTRLSGWRRLVVTPFAIALAAGWIVVIGTLVEQNLDSANTSGSVVFGFFPAALVEIALIVFAPFAAVIFLMWVWARFETIRGRLAVLVGPVLGFALGGIVTNSSDAAISTSPDTGFHVYGFWFGVGILLAGTVAFAVVGLANWRSRSR